jgi:MoaA/NifB/PqqE/SkfB family radical SAM enzyme
LTDTPASAPLSAVVNSNGELTLPREVQQENGLEPGSVLSLRVTPEGILLRPPLSQLRKVYIEPTSCCNLACRTCMRNSWVEPMGYMTLRTFEQIMSGIAYTRGKVTCFFGGFGEPLMHPAISEMIEHAARVAAKVELITNGILLDAELSTRLIQSGLHTLWVSLDGASPEKYEDVRQSDSLGEVLRNISMYKDIHRRLRGAAPDIGVVFVAMKRNIDEFPALIRQSAQLGISRFMLTNVLPYTHEMCDEVLYRHSMERWGGNPSPWNPSVSVPEMDLNASTKEALLRIWSARPGGHASREDRCPFIEQHSTSVDWAGNVSPCLALMHSHESRLFDRPRSVQHYRLGNVNERSLQELWLADEYQQFRRKLEQFDFSPCTLCGGCEMAEANQEDCFGNEFPTCGGCLWARGLIQCP